MSMNKVLAILPALAMACFMGFGVVHYDEEGRTGTKAQVEQNIKATIAEATAKQESDAKALGCSVDPSQGWGGFAVVNVVDPGQFTNPKYFNTRHGVDNMDTMTVYRVSFDEGWKLSKAGEIRVVSGCAK
jgi:hypothetical protein